MKDTYMENKNENAEKYRKKKANQHSFGVSLWFVNLFWGFVVCLVGWFFEKALSKFCNI